LSGAVAGYRVERGVGWYVAVVEDRNTRTRKDNMMSPKDMMGGEYTPEREAQRLALTHSTPPSELDRKLRAAASNATHEVYCDTGPHDGMWRIELPYIYLTSDELKELMVGDEHH
jgi:hypothetical protein